MSSQRAVQRWPHVTEELCTEVHRSLHDWRHFIHIHSHLTINGVCLSETKITTWVQKTGCGRSYEGWQCPEIKLFVWLIWDGLHGNKGCGLTDALSDCFWTLCPPAGREKEPPRSGPARVSKAQICDGMTLLGPMGNSQDVCLFQQDICLSRAWLCRKL